MKNPRITGVFLYFRTMKRLLSLILTLAPFILNAQRPAKSFNRDSLFHVLLKDVPEEYRGQMEKDYNAGDDEEKTFLLIRASLGFSSKKQLIDNIDSNYSRINRLKTEYSKLVPGNYVVRIEFNPPNPLLGTAETINLMILQSIGNGTRPFQEWNLRYRSDSLDHMLAIVGWKENTLKTIKGLLTDAHCISIENGEITTIGYARSGMGLYSYKLFDSNLSEGQIKKYNDGCAYIYYKKNIVLEYGGGAIGSQCFLD